MLEISLNIIEWGAGDLRPRAGGGKLQAVGALSEQKYRAALNAPLGLRIA